MDVNPNKGAGVDGGQRGVLQEDVGVVYREIVLTNK